MIKIRAKFRLDEKVEVFWNKDVRYYTFTAVSDDTIPENERFTKHTPNGKFEMTCTNPSINDTLQVNEYYYFDIIKAEK